MCFAPQRGALFPLLNFQERSNAEVQIQWDALDVVQWLRFSAPKWNLQVLQSEIVEASSTRECQSSKAKLQGSLSRNSALARAPGIQCVSCTRALRNKISVSFVQEKSLMLGSSPTASSQLSHAVCTIVFCFLRHISLQDLAKEFVLKQLSHADQSLLLDTERTSGQAPLERQRGLPPLGNSIEIESCFREQTVLSLTELLLIEEACDATAPQAKVSWP
eukprot:s137_g30.t2